MRVLLKAAIPVEAGNAAIRSGKLGPVVESILKELHPENAFFYVDAQGRRTANLILDLADPSQIPAVVEPFFLAFNASVEIYPVMLTEDLMKAGPSIEQAAQRYGQS